MKLKVITRLFISYSTLLAASFLLAACGSNPTKKQSSALPDWVVNEPATSGHVYGVGSAPIYVDAAKSLSQAQDAARVSMIQKLKVTVSGSLTQDTEEVRQTGKQTQLTKIVRNVISSKIPDAQLSNLNVQENFVDEKNKVSYSLVHLDRVKASSNLRRQITELDDSAIKLGADTSNSLSTLKQVQALVPALTMVEQREALAVQRQLVDMSSRTTSKPDDLVALEKRIQRLFDQLSVSLSADNAAGKKIRSGLTSHLTDLGLRISANNADLNFSYAADIRPVEKSGRYYVFVSGQVKISEASGRILSEFSQEAKGVSGASMAQAEHKAINALVKKLGKELAKSLLEKID